MEFEIINADTVDELLEQVYAKEQDGWKKQGDVGVVTPELNGGDMACYQVLSRPTEIDHEANRERMLKMANDLLGE